jgi:prepilin-type N-terminal cleavage/methylation domain-containing protein
MALSRSPRCFNWKRFIPAFNKPNTIVLVSRQTSSGFTLIELTIATVIATVILSASLGLLTEQRRQILGDRTRASINDNLRIATDLIATDIKQAGERLESDTELPGVSIIDGGGTVPDQLILQRQLLSEKLPVCQDIAAGTGNRTIDISVTTGGTDPNCVYSYSATSEPSTTLTALSPTDNLRALRKYRCEQDIPAAVNTDPCARTVSATTDCQQLGGTDKECVWAYIHDPVNNRGEFFLYSFEESATCTSATFSGRTCQQLKRADSSSWLYSYRYIDRPQIYIAEERAYSLSPDTDTPATNDYVLNLSINQQPVQRMVNQLTDFQVRGKLSTGMVDSFNPNKYFVTDWQDLQAIQITLSTLNPSPQTINLSNSNLSLTSQFLPRNVASRQ